MSEFVERVLESKGKSIDEAIFRGLQELGVSIDEVRIDTIQEGSKGLLGLGAKPFIVRLTTRPIDLSAMEPEKKPRRERSPRPVRTERGSEAAETAAQESARQEKNGQEESRAKDRPPRSRGGRSRNERAGRGEQEGRGSRERSARIIPEDTTVYTPYVAGETVCPGADFLTGMLIRMGVDCGIGFSDTEEALKLRIDSDAMGILIGYRGETLDAMQYLTGLVVNRDREEYRRVVLDTENYRNKREDTLVRLARKLASQARASGQSIVLEPMNPYERRVLHATLQNNPYVETHSEGEEPNRRVVITPKGTGSAEDQD